MGICLSQHMYFSKMSQEFRAKKIRVSFDTLINKSLYFARMLHDELLATD